MMSSKHLGRRMVKSPTYINNLSLHLVLNVCETLEKRVQFLTKKKIRSFVRRRYSELLMYHTVLIKYIGHCIIIVMTLVMTHCSS